jgi:hypothetical protein
MYVRVSFFIRDVSTVAYTLCAVAVGLYEYRENNHVTVKLIIYIYIYI